MTIRQFFVLADDRPYNPHQGEKITYHVELDHSLGQPLKVLQPEHSPIGCELTIQVTHVEDSWGPDTQRVEGFMRSARTNKAIRVIGHHKTRFAVGEHRIGLLQVSEDD